MVQQNLSGTESLEARVTPTQFYRELTDPRDHNPAHFGYIVHALNPAAKLGLLLFAIQKGGYDPHSEIDLLIEPERIAEKKLFSTSIINQDHTGTWGNIFFILDVPWENFVSLQPRDCGTNIFRSDFALEYARRPYLTPRQLIEQTRRVSLNSPHAYNEVVVTGTNNEKKVKITGVGIKRTDVGEGTIREPSESGQMRDIGERLSVPIIEFTRYSRIHDSEAEIGKGHPKGHVRAVYINRNGYRYFFEGDWEETKIKEVGRGDKNFYGGNNPVTTEEYLSLRPAIAQKLATALYLNGQNFLRELDQWFKINSEEMI